MAVAEGDGRAAPGDEEVQEHRTRLWVGIEWQWQPLPAAPRHSLRCRQRGAAGVGRRDDRGSEGGGT